LANRLLLSSLLAIGWLTTAPLAIASPLDQLRDDIAAAETGDPGRYAPSTLERARTYLGAATIAKEKNSTDELDSALNNGRESLVEAKRISSDFKARHADLINLRQETEAAEKALSLPASPAVPNPFRNAKSEADLAWSESIRLMEAGQLNESEQQASLAQSSYGKALDTAMPEISSLAASRLSEASSAGAKRYALHTYVTAKDAVAQLRAYADGLSAQRPEHPIAALDLATDALQLSRQIRQLRKDDSSFENMLIENRAFRRELARSLGMAVDAAHPTTDVPAADILQRAAAMRQALADEKEAHTRDLDQLEQARAEIEQLKADQQKMSEASNEQLASMKEAFRAKLERETFDLNRQKQVKALLKPEEASVLVNLDGSLLIRLGSLQFASGHSQVNKQYTDLIKRVSQALKIYSDRNIRVEGHTDNQGDVKVNQKLSLKRAEAVRDALIRAGLAAGRVKALGYGEVRPIASNEFEKGRAMNRRIDIVIEPAHD